MNERMIIMAIPLKKHGLTRISHPCSISFHQTKYKIQQTHYYTIHKYTYINIIK